MTQTNSQHNRPLLEKIARDTMHERGLLTDFPAAVISELQCIKGPASGDGLKDLRALAWCSIDNDDSRDLDQLSVAVPGDDGNVKILVALADVDALVRKGSQIDLHAQHNTTSVYTAAEIFPMLPEKLSTDLTSLNYHTDRVAVIVEIVLDQDAVVQASDVYRAFVRNQARLSYKSVAGWLEGKGKMPEVIGTVSGLDENIKLQYQLAAKLKQQRHLQGALNLDTVKAKPIFEGDEITELEEERRNIAKDIIEDFMIAANGVTAKYLSAKNFPSIRRVVREPERWDRIVQLAAEHHYTLPATPDSKALDQFLVKAREADYLRFPDISLSVLKLLGSGEYSVEVPGGAHTGHFGLAVRDYAHSTAPNRRYPDLITHRLLKAAIAGEPVPYTVEELKVLAAHCSKSENASRKVERQVGKSASAILFQQKIGEEFQAIVTGASAKGTWVRTLHPPVDGRLNQPAKDIDVGDEIRVKLEHVDIKRGFIDFREVK